MALIFSLAMYQLILPIFYLTLPQDTIYYVCRFACLLATSVYLSNFAEKDENLGFPRCIDCMFSFKKNPSGIKLCLASINKTFANINRCVRFGGGTHKTYWIIEFCWTLRQNGCEFVWLDKCVCDYYIIRAP